MMICMTWEKPVYSVENLLEYIAWILYIWTCVVNFEMVLHTHHRSTTG